MRSLRLRFYRKERKGRKETYPPERYAGIILLRLPRKPMLSDIDIAIDTVIEALNRGADIAGKLWVVRHKTIRQFTPRNEP